MDVNRGLVTSDGRNWLRYEMIGLTKDEKWRLPKG